MFSGILKELILLPFIPEFNCPLPENAETNDVLSDHIEKNFLLN